MDLHSKLDRVGALTSFACAIHCMALPLVITLLPLLGLAWLADERIEICFLSISALLGISSICYGVRKHGRKHCLAIVGVGISLMVIGHMAEDSPLGVIAAVCGGLGIATAHVVNNKLCKTCFSCHNH